MPAYWHIQGITLRFDVLFCLQGHSAQDAAVLSTRQKNFRGQTTSERPLVANSTPECDTPNLIAVHTTEKSSPANANKCCVLVTKPPTRPRSEHNMPA